MHPFAAHILTWSESLDRPMPWRGERDPYRIWLSEVILQQTRVQQGMGYYLRFVERFPTVHDLAAAEEDDVLALWQGLGYYSRARNLHKAAQQVSERGAFPDSYRGLLGLPGVGPYTAAAIASFAYDEAVAVVDGNVYRVLARYFGIDAPINKPAGQKVFSKLAQELLPPEQAACYNQAIMDFGATVCTPKRPACATCPLQESCAALREGTVDKLPVKLGKTKRRARYFDYLHLERSDGHALVLRRPAGDIWQGLYDFPLLESAMGFAERPKVIAHLTTIGVRSFTVRQVSLPQKHVLSHQDLFVKYWHIRIDGKGISLTLEQDKGDVQVQWVSREDLLQLGIPRVLQRYLEQDVSSLNFDGDA